MKLALASPALLAALALPAIARAGAFDARGEYHADTDAIAWVDFETLPERYLPDGVDMKCLEPMFHAAIGDDALDGTGFVRIKVVHDCAERFTVHLPAEQASYRASVWARHGGLDASLVVAYQASAGLDRVSARLAPTGRTTSDGWVELATNEIPVDGPALARAYLQVVDYADGDDGLDLDSFEIVPRGVFVAQRSCAGVGDPTCSDEELCIDARCVLGRASVPPLPADAIRSDVIDALESRARLFYGGVRSRELYLPSAIAAFEEMRSAKTAFAFWRAQTTAIHRLHDWHTGPHGGPRGPRPTSRRLNACFFEGDANLSHGAWPKDAKYADVLVSHVGPNAANLKPGDRLVAVDGVHPFEWAAALAGVDWGFHVATDPDNFADYAEAMGGPYWAGGALMVRFAHDFTVIRCDPKTEVCGLPETIAVASLVPGGGGPDVACDNRPSYHFEEGKNPDPTKHYVYGDFYRGRIAGTTKDEAIFGMVWDTLYGGGDFDGGVNKQISDAITDWKANARGVILDHRAGNGGTLDAAENLTRLVRPAEPLAITRIPIEIGGYGGPPDLAGGLADFVSFAGATPFTVGSADHDPTLPVALILHRDGSASDYMPFGMKGAPHVRIFAPHGTAGAFSTFIEFFSWGGYGGMGFQIGSGDTIASDGRTLIGHGVQPDEVVLPKQSDLLAGKDTLFEAALAWVKKELKP